MKTAPQFSRFRRIRTAVPAALFAGVALTCASAAGEPAEIDAEVSNTAKNLARMNCGAKIEWITPGGRSATVASADENNAGAAALITDDDTLSCPLPEGETTFIIALRNASLVDRFTFLNEDAAARGEVKIAVANYRLPVSSPKWIDVDGRISFSNKRLFNLSMVGVEARYVKVSFNVQKGGRIASLGLYGSETLQRFAERREQIGRVWQTSPGSRRLEDRLNFNFANLYAKARVVYVSSGTMPAARRMIDDDNETNYRFAANDPHPTVIVELAGDERLHRVSARYAMASGRMDVYALNRFPSDPDGLDEQKPVASVSDEAGGGKAAVDFDPRGARFVALRWTPAHGSERPFEIAEIDAFGDTPMALLDLVEAPGLHASTSMTVVFPGEVPPDISSTLGTPAIPPAIPHISE